MPAAMKGLRSCGRRGVSVLVAVWAANVIVAGGLEPMMNGVMETGAIFGGPGKVLLGDRPWALIVAPCGIEAMRTNESPSTGSTVVAATFIHSPGSKWMPVGGASAFPVATTRCQS